MMIKIRLIILGCLALGLTAPSQAQVNTATQAGFSIQQSYRIDAAPSEVFATLVNKVGLWWSDAHTYSGAAKNMYMQAKAGGCFCETLEKGEVEHLRIVYFQPDQQLRLSGGLGPLQSLAVSGSLTISLQQEKQQTQVTVDYLVAGYSEQGLQVWAEPVDSVLTEQFQRLKRLIEEKSIKPDS